MRCRLGWAVPRRLCFELMSTFGLASTVATYFSRNFCRASLFRCLGNVNDILERLPSYEFDCLGRGNRNGLAR